MEIEINGLELFAHHGVLPEERRLGQRFLLDLRITPSREEGAETDSIDDTVDYADVIERVVEVFTERPYALLEAVSAQIARVVLLEFAVDKVRVRVRKPEPPLPYPLDGVGVVLERSRSAEGD